MKQRLVESDNSDFAGVDEREQQDDGHGGGPTGSASFFTATLNLFKSLVGIGVLALPTAFYQSGWLAGIILLPVCAAAMLYLSNQVITIADKKETSAKNLIEFVKETCPHVYVASVNVCLFCFQIGICISYVIFFIKYIQQSFCKIDGDMFPCSSKVISVLVSLTLLIPLVMIKDMNKFKPFSLIGNVVTVSSLVIVSIYCVYDLATQGTGEVALLNMSDIGNSIGVFIFTFEGIGVYFNIRNSMIEPNKFNSVLNVAIAVGICIYCMVGFLGYMTFGSNVADLILFNFSDSNIPIQIVQVAYCISLIMTFPLQIFPCVSVVEIKLKKVLLKKQAEYQNVSQDDSASALSGAPNTLERPFQTKMTIYSIITRMGFVLVTFSVGIFFDKVSDFISLTGDICGIYLCYVVPVFVIYYQDKEIKAGRKYLNYFIMLVSIGFGIYGLYSTILKIIDDFF